MSGEESDYNLIYFLTGIKAGLDKVKRGKGERENALGHPPTQIIIIWWIIISINRMQKSQKIQKMLMENNIERDNHTLVLRLKKKIEELNLIIHSQQLTIDSFKKDVKTTKINEM